MRQTLVQDTYGCPYSFQQQNDCQERGTFHLTVHDHAYDYQNHQIPEVINVKEMGVSFAAWLSRDPNEWNGDPDDKNCLDLFWERNFYPDIQTVANDLHAKGLIEAGSYAIDIDW